jgi:hypothetical protein
MPSIYCVKTEPDKFGNLVYKNLDVKREVLYMSVTPRKEKNFGYPPGIPMFITAEGTYLQLCNMESYLRVLGKNSFDLLNPSQLVNMKLVERIEAGAYGNEAFFIGCGDEVKVAVSRAKTEEYKHLVKKRSFNPAFGRG